MSKRCFLPRPAGRAGLQQRRAAVPPERAGEQGGCDVLCRRQRASGREEEEEEAEGESHPHHCLDHQEDLYRLVFYVSADDESR